jgi:hypothetical protein
MGNVFFLGLQLIASFYQHLVVQRRVRTVLFDFLVRSFKELFCHVYATPAWIEGDCFSKKRVQLQAHKKHSHPWYFSAVANTNIFLATEHSYSFQQIKKHPYTLV